MRHLTRTVVSTCSVPLNQGKKYVAVELLTKEILYCVVDVKSKAQELFDQVSSYLGMRETFFFGLSILIEDEHVFLNLDTKLSKYAPKCWKSQHNSGLNGTGKPLLILHLRIKCYVDCHLLLRDNVTRLHYYLQLRENVIKHAQTCMEERYFLLCAYALQADLGNFSEEKHHGQYFDPKLYFPIWLIERVGEAYIIQNIPAMHKDNHGLSKGKAHTAYIQEASSSDAPHNLHLYRLRRKKSETVSTISLGICPKGIEIYEENNGCAPKQLLSTFLWTNISKLYFEKKKFEIRAISYLDTRKYTYYASSDEKAKFLLQLCKATHQFNLAMQPRVAELKQFSQEAEKKSYRESYIYSDSLDLEWEQEHGSNMSLHDFSTLPKANKGLSDQRISVISNASSNTTSGIVSDRVQSLDGSEDDLELEIMINSPPAPSIEYLPPFSFSEVENKNISKLAEHKYSSASSVAQSFTDGYTLEKYRSTPEKQLNCECPPRPISPEFPTSHSKTSSSGISRTDSSSSQQSASTVKSRYQQNLNEPNCCEANFSLNYNALGLAHSCASSVDSTAATCFTLANSIGENANTSEMTGPIVETEKKRISDNLKLNNAINKRHTPSSVFSFSSKEINEINNPRPFGNIPPPNTAGSRILTSFGVQAPLVLPPSHNLNLPHLRTKIGVSSLSRPAVLSRPTGTVGISSNSQIPNSLLKYETNGSTEIKNVYATLPPTALYGSGKNSGQPTYVPVINDRNYLDVHSSYGVLQNMQYDKVSAPPSLQTIPASPLDPNIVNETRTYPNTCLPIINSRSNYDTMPVSALGKQEFLYIPPPPVYSVSSAEIQKVVSTISTPITSIPPAYTHQHSFANISSKPLGVAVNNPIPCMRPTVTRARSEESCRSLETLALQKSVHVGRAQSMDRKPRSEMLNYKSPPPYQDPGSLSEIIPARSLDIDNLRKRSKDLDLPLISALCNDQSLIPIAHPPTPPNRRFVCGSNSDVSQVSPVSSNNNNNNRPLSWHMDSMNIQWNVTQPISSDAYISLPAQNSVVSQTKANSSICLQNTPIMTSFGKTVHSANLPSNGMLSANNFQQQMIPVKLTILGSECSVN